MSAVSAEEIRYAMDNRHGLNPAELTSDALSDAGCMDFVMPMPKEFKERVRHIGNLLAQMTTNSKCVKDENLGFVVRQLCQTLSYLLNSCSWQEGKLHDFDYEEIQAKLERLIKS